MEAAILRACSSSSSPFSPSEIDAAWDSDELSMASSSSSSSGSREAWIAGASARLRALAESSDGSGSGGGSGSNSSSGSGSGTSKVGSENGDADSGGGRVDRDEDAREGGAEVAQAGRAAQLIDALSQEWEDSKRHIVAKALHNANQASLALLGSDSSAHELGALRLRRVLDVSFHCASSDYCSADVPYELLEEVFECCSPKALPQALDILQGVSSYFTDPQRIAVNKNRLAVLRAFACARRRLPAESSDGNSILRGRLYALLSRIVALTDKSTQGETPGGDLDELLDSIDDQEVADQLRATGEDGGDANLLDSSVYAAFISLANLPSVEKWVNEKTARPGNDWAQLQLLVSQVLQSLAKTRPNDVEDVRVVVSPVNGSILSPATFRAQLRDRRFRSAMLVQTLILCHSAKFALEAGEKSANAGSNASSKISTVERWQKDATQLLRECPRIGQSRLEVLRRFLRGRESNFLSWAQRKFPPFERHQPAQTVKRRATMDGGMLDDAPSLKRTRASSDHVTSLSDALATTREKPLDRLDAIRHRSGKVVPATDEFFGQFLEDEDPESGMEEEYFRRNDRITAWRARMIAQGLLLPSQQSVRIDRVIGSVLGNKWTDVTAKRKAWLAERESKAKAEAAEAQAELKRAEAEEAGGDVGHESREDVAEEEPATANDEVVLNAEDTDLQQQGETEMVDA